MNEQNNMQIENNLKEKEGEFNNNGLINNMGINNSNKDSLLNEISLLRKEMMELKAQHIKDKEILKKEFEDEINLLKKEINHLTNQLNELKNKKNKNNINNINNINNDLKEDINDKDSDSENNLEEEAQSYSIECLSNRLNIEILQGTEKANIDLIVRNNSNVQYPKNSYLICDNKNSLLLCEKVELNELRPKEQQKISILFKNLKFISKGKYNCFVKLMVNNKKYNSAFELTVDVLDNHINNDYQIPSYLKDNQMQNMDMINFQNVQQMINNFKIKFELYNNDIITDEKIEIALKNNNYDFNKAFESLFV